VTQCRDAFVHIPVLFDDGEVGVFVHNAEGFGGGGNGGLFGVVELLGLFGDEVSYFAVGGEGEWVEVTGFDHFAVLFAADRVTFVEVAEEGVVGIVAAVLELE